MEKKEKKQLKKRTKVLLRALAVLIAIVLLWSLAVEPMLLTVTEIEFADARLPKEMDGIRVVYVSDIHVGTYYSPADVERVTAKIATLNPDMVLFGGDLLQHEGDAVKVDRERVAKAFEALKPPLGKYAVYGNHDIICLQTKTIAEMILSHGGFTILENDATQVVPGFYIAGTEPWPMEGENSPRNHADVGKVAWTTENNAFSLLLSHEPAQIKKNAAFPFALQLSGHTHGGQIALPITGPIMLPNGTEIFKEGFYTLENTRMYVSRGIGTSVIRVRFLEPPQIVVVTLHRK